MNKKSFFGGLAIGLAGILAVGAVGWFTKGFREWKKEEPVIDNPIEDSTTSDEAGVYDENGNNLADGNIHAMPMRLTFTGAKTLASNTSNDITTNEDGTKEVTVQATLNRDIEMLFDWSLEWANSAVTDTLSDYVTVTPTADGAATAKVKMLKRFTKKVILKCDSRTVDGLSGSCSLDCSPTRIFSNHLSFRDPAISGLSVRTDKSIGLFSNSTATQFFSVSDTDLGINQVDFFLDMDSSLLFSDYYEKSWIELEFAGLEETTDFGFEKFYVSDSSLTESIPSRGAPMMSYPFAITEDSLKNAFTFSAESGYTIDDFYTHGLSFLKKNGGILDVKLTVCAQTYAKYGSKIDEFPAYFKIDVNKIEGISIDINGMENIVF